MIRVVTGNGWNVSDFEELYASVGDDLARIPWASRQPHPMLVLWLDERPPGVGRQALVVGCGLGDDAEELGRRGYRVSAFDYSATAIDWCRRRFPTSAVQYRVADLFDLPGDGRGGSRSLSRSTLSSRCRRSGAPRRSRRSPRPLRRAASCSCDVSGVPTTRRWRSGRGLSAAATSADSVQRGCVRSRSLRASGRPAGRTSTRRTSADTPDNTANRPRVSRRWGLARLGGTRGQGCLGRSGRSDSAPRLPRLAARNIAAWLAGLKSSPEHRESRRPSSGEASDGVADQVEVGH